MKEPPPAKQGVEHHGKSHGPKRGLGVSGVRPLASLLVLINYVQSGASRSSTTPQRSTERKNATWESKPEAQRNRGYTGCSAVLRYEAARWQPQVQGVAGLGVSVRTPSC